LPEEEAFSMFVTLMNKYGLRDLFVQDMPGLHLHLYQFERLLEDLEPALYCHLHRRDVKPQLYATQWFLTLFAYRFPLQLVLRIYDLILSDGLEGAILKFGIVLMQKNAEALLGMKDMGILTTFLKERLFDVYIDKSPSSSSILESGFFGSTSGVDKEVYRADLLVRDAVSVKVTPEMLKQYTIEWKEQQRTEKEREIELQGLREKSSSLEIKVRQLERRVEQSDMEHIHATNDLIKTKVENEGLADENETLRTKVQELQRIVETQPEEVEAKMQTEMDAVMQKNIVVHNENRALEEQIAEMESQLVDTKLQWATVSIHTAAALNLMLTAVTDERGIRKPEAEMEQHHSDDEDIACFTGLSNPVSHFIHCICEQCVSISSPQHTPDILQHLPRNSLLHFTGVERPGLRFYTVHIPQTIPYPQGLANTCTVHVVRFGGCDAQIMTHISVYPRSLKAY
jgi:hypothetical protein